MNGRGTNASQTGCRKSFPWPIERQSLDWHSDSSLEVSRMKMVHSNSKRKENSLFLENISLNTLIERKSSVAI